MFIKCDRIYTEQGCISGVIETAQHSISRIYRDGEALPDGCKPISFTGKRLIPGLIDIHTHGYGGYSAQSTSVEDILSLREIMASVGVTSFLATAGEHFDGEYDNLQAIVEAMKPRRGSNLLGVHMEGPFLNPAKKGAFAPAQLMPPSVTKLESYLAAASGTIKYMTLSPELDPDGSFISLLRSLGIAVAGGHTCATYQQYSQAIRQGISASAHTGNAMTQIDRREVGAVGAALLSGEIYSEVICDFIHLSREMLEIMLRVKPGGVEKLIVISDSQSIAGSPAGNYTVAGTNYTITPGGKIHLEDGTISGSSKNVLFGLQNLVEALGIPMEQALLATGLNPARLLGMESAKGSIAVGKDADMVALDDDYNLSSVIVMGETVYSN